MTSSLIISGTFLGITLLMYLIGRLLIAPGRNQPAEIGTGNGRPLVLGRMTEPFAGVLPTSKKKRDKLQHDLVRAGFYHRKAVFEYLAMRNAAIVAWLIFMGAAIVASVGPDESLTNKVLMLGGAGLVLIYGLPRVVLASLSSSRSRRIEESLPDALDMITMAMFGGLPLHKAMHRVSNELANSHKELACELTIIHRQADAGSMQMALEQFGQRVDRQDVTALATIIRHAEKVGGNIAGAFRDYADSVRRARRQRAEERGNKASVKLLFPVIIFLAPPVYIMLLGPAVLELRNFVQKEHQPGGAFEQNLNEFNLPQSAATADSNDTRRR